MSALHRTANKAAGDPVFRPSSFHFFERPPAAAGSLSARTRLRRGFTLLEVLLATLIMGIAVAGLLSNLNTSMLNASRLSDSERAALLARRQMDTLLVEQRLPMGRQLTGEFPPGTMGDAASGWRATVTVFDARPGSGPGALVLQRIGLQIFWTRGGSERTFDLEGFRRHQLGAGDAGSALTQ